MPQAPRCHGGALLGASAREIVFTGIESEALLLLLDQAGICASACLACLADSDEPSHVVRAMKPESAASRQMVRFSRGERNVDGQDRRRRRRRERNLQPIESLLTERLFLTAEK